MDPSCIVPGIVERVDAGYIPGVALHLHLARIQHVHLGFVFFSQKSVSANTGGYVVMTWNAAHATHAFDGCKCQGVGCRSTHFEVALREIPYESPVLNTVSLKL